MVAELRLGDIPVDVVRKDIKNVHLTVHPPAGTVRIAAPRGMSMDAIRAFAISKLGWIKRNQKRLVEQVREAPREFLDRESHYVWGQRYLLKIVETNSAPTVTLKHRTMVLAARSTVSREQRADILAAWYREQLRAAVPPIIAKWERMLGIEVERVFVRRMMTKWGSANPKRRTIRLNTDLAKKLPDFLDYVVLHELAHFISSRHDQQFVAVLDRQLPNWRSLRAELNTGMLTADDDRPQKRTPHKKLRS